MSAATPISLQMKGGGSDEARLGLVTRKPLAGGKGSLGPPCQYCGEVDGHTAQCPVVSMRGFPHEYRAVDRH